MNLVIVTKHYGHISGASVATCEFVKHWAEHVERVDVICSIAWYRQEDVPDAPNIHVHALPRFNPIAIFHTAQAVASSDSILYSSDDYGVFGKLPGLPYVMTNHSNWPNALRAGLRYFAVGLMHTPLYALNFLLADAVVSYSQFGQRWVARFNRTSLVIRNGISARETGYRPSLKHPNVMTVGRMDSRKGALLVKVIEELRSLGVEFYLYVLGQVVQHKLQELIDNDRLYSLGYVPNVGDYLKECDVFVLTSRMENLSLAVTEALHAGKPVVCFDVGGLGEVVTEETGALIKPFDVRRMAHSIADLLLDEEERLKRGKRAREIVRDFDWDKSAESYIQVFRDVLQGTQPCS